MRRMYEKPRIEVENFVFTQQISSCSAMKIGFQNSDCVLKDSDATDYMKTFAQYGWFLDTNVCTAAASDNMANDGICYHTMANMAFTS